MTTVYNKLVRSRVLEILGAKGIAYKYHVAERDGFESPTILEES